MSNFNRENSFGSASGHDDQDTPQQGYSQSFMEKQMDRLVDLVESMSVSLQRGLTKPRRNESGAECSRVLLATGNQTMVGHFPFGLDVLFVQASHPSKRYSSYYFQQKTVFWQNLVDYGVVDWEPTVHNFLEVMQARNWGFTTIVPNDSWLRVSPEQREIYARALIDEINTKKPRKVVCIGYNAFSLLMPNTMTPKQVLENQDNILFRFGSDTELMMLPDKRHAYNDMLIKSAYVHIAKRIGSSAKCSAHGTPSSVGSPSYL